MNLDEEWMLMEPDFVWSLILNLWRELSVEQLLIAHTPPERRWLVDRLIERVRRMDEIFEIEAEAKASMDEDDEV
jgi:hypothetical protein